MYDSIVAKNSSLYLVAKIVSIGSSGENGQVSFSHL